MPNSYGGPALWFGGFFVIATLLIATLLVIATTEAPTTAQDRPLDADFAEVYRVGGSDAPRWAEFTAAPLLSFDADGRLYALDGSIGHVVVIDQSGSLVRIVGGHGEGPGEFNQLGAFVVWPDGRLAVADFGHNAYQVFSPDGEFERFVRMGSGDDMFSGVSNMRPRLRPDPTGLAIVAEGLPSRFGTFTDLLGELVGTEAPHEEGVDDRGLERLDLRGNEVATETILEAWRPPPAREEAEDLSLSDLQDVSSIFGMMMGGVSWFEPDLLWDVLPDGAIAYSDSSAYEIKLTDRAGRVTRTLRRPLVPRPVTRQVRSAVREHELRSLEQGTGDGSFSTPRRVPVSLQDQMTEAIREEIESREFFEEVSVLAALRMTWDGALWIQRRGAEPWDSTGPIDVMRVAGEYVGTFAAGATEMPTAFGPSGLVAFVELDDLDIPSIVVRRLPTAVR